MVIGAARELAELVEEYGRLQFQAGRLAAAIEHHYAMAFVLRGEAQPEREQPGQAAQAAASAPASQPPPQKPKAYAAPIRLDSRLGRLWPLLPRAFAAEGTGGVNSGMQIRRRLSDLLGGDEPCQHDELHNLLRRGMEAGLVTRVAHARYKWIGGEAHDATRSGDPAPGAGVNGAGADPGHGRPGPGGLAAVLPR